MTLSLGFGCSSQQKAHLPVPAWVGSPYDFCKSAEEICGVGSGKSLKEADLAAKQEIGSFFRLQLTSSLVSSLSSNQKTTDSTIDSQQKESFQQVISAQVDELIEGVEITQRHILNDKEYYSLTRLKKNLLEDSLKLKLNEIDQQRNQLLINKARLAQFPLKNLLVERQGAEKLLLMLDRPLIGFKKSLNWWEDTLSMLQTPKTVKINFDINSDEQWENLITSAIAQAGHKIITSQNARYLIKSTLSMKMEPINVEGFLKARVQWRASALDQERGSEVSGAIDEVIDVTARNKEQLWHKAKDHFKTKVLEKIYLLNI